MKTSTNTPFSSLQNAHGAIPYNMTNDYMFRAVLQSNNTVLRGLICSLLHLSEKELVSAKITNPVILGESIERKEIRLDINVLLNNNTLINLEMQVANRLNWKNRSVIYLCRSFDQLNHGTDYTDALPAIHIGFLDYSLFTDNAEFYATYKLINIKKHYVYSDNLTLSVVDLSRIDLASEEDKKYHIDDWAKLFKAATWEEIKMLASRDKYIDEASSTIFRLSADEQIRKQCRDREEYYQDLRNYERVNEKQAAVIAKQAAAIREKDASIREKDASIREKDASIKEKESIIQELLAEIKYMKHNELK